MPNTKIRSRTGNNAKLFIKRPSAEDFIEVKDAKNIGIPQQPMQTAPDEYVSEADGITEEVKTGGRDGGELAFQIGVRNENDPGTLAVLASKEVVGEEAQFKVVYADGSGYIIERVAVYKAEPSEAKKNEIILYDCAGKCNSVLTPFESEDELA